MAVRAAEIHASKPALRLCGVNIAQAVITAKVAYPHPLRPYARAPSVSRPAQCMYRSHPAFGVCKRSRARAGEWGLVAPSRKTSGGARSSSSIEPQLPAPFANRQRSSVAP